MKAESQFNVRGAPTLDDVYVIVNSGGPNLVSILFRQPVVGRQLLIRLSLQEAFELFNQLSLAVTAADTSERSNGELKS